jgi:hypothetical protein
MSARSALRFIVALLTAALLIHGVSSGDAGAASDPSQRCAAARFTASGKYVSCRLEARAKVVKTGVAPDFTKCDDAFKGKWEKIDKAGCPLPGEAATVLALGAMCEDDLLGPICGPVAGLTDCTVDSDCIVVDGIGCCTCGMAGQQAAVNKVKAEFLPAQRRACCAGTACAAEYRCKENLSAVCQSGKCVLAGLPTTTTTSSSTSTSISSTTTTTLSNCFTDTGDGTIHDICTGLQWEKKTATPGLHDVGNRYSWAGCCNGECTLVNFCQPNAAAAATCAAQAGEGAFGCSECPIGTGTCNVDPFGYGGSTTVWDWLNQVNTAGFAGHSDWRLPSEAGCNSCFIGYPTFSCSSCSSPHQLETILLAPYPCGTSPCIDSIFGPTATAGYWSAATDPTVAYRIWAVDFGLSGGGGDVVTADGWLAGYVRAVR